VINGNLSNEYVYKKTGTPLRQSSKECHVRTTKRINTAIEQLQLKEGTQHLRGG